MKKEKKQSQCDRLINYLNTHTAITPMDSWNKLGIYRLGARVWDLRHKRGYRISKEMVEVKNRFGEKCRVAQYRLES